MNASMKKEKESVAQAAVLHYYNSYLLKAGVITEKEYRQMKLLIDRRCK